MTTRQMYDLEFIRTAVQAAGEGLDMVGIAERTGRTRSAIANFFSRNKGMRAIRDRVRAGEDIDAVAYKIFTGADTPPPAEQPPELEALLRRVVREELARVGFQVEE